MSKKYDGGQAFPSAAAGPEGGFSTEGMTLRDYFAGQALLALISCGPGNEAVGAKMAYGFADAMLEEREKK